MLGDLEDRFNSLEEGSKNMVAQVCISHYFVLLRLLRMINEGEAAGHATVREELVQLHVKLTCYRFQAYVLVVCSDTRSKSTQTNTWIISRNYVARLHVSSWLQMLLLIIFTCKLDFSRDLRMPEDEH
jgi:hypothetical protein